VSNARSNGGVNRYLMTWIRSLLALGLVPETRTIEEVSQAIWEERERFWIAHWRGINPGLLNVSAGGNQPRNSCQKAIGNRPEVRAQRSRSSCDLWQRPEYSSLWNRDNIPAETRIARSLNFILIRTRPKKELKDRRYGHLLAWRDPAKRARHLAGIRRHHGRPATNS
jgi:hypothetical protein